MVTYARNLEVIDKRWFKIKFLCDKQEKTKGRRIVQSLRKFCRDICAFYKAHKTKASACYYNQGFKRCVECEIFLKCRGMRCPCCDRILRIKPHNNISKGRLLRGLTISRENQVMMSCTPFVLMKLRWFVL